uniref:ATP synthase subunit e, mitochondrial n=1 Tax=Rhabditophanes sp. KR3021 TaxID=114890 RepID=A0AC35UDQ2_9BILA
MSTAAIRNLFQPIISLKRAYLNPHEHFGRANITRACLATYVAIYMGFKWNGQRKANAITAEKHALKESVLKDALAKAGI